MTFKHISIAAAVACVLVGSASADEVKYEAGKTKLVASSASFAALDRNGDHRISRSEAGFDQAMSHAFAEIDTDGDGFVSSAEYAAAEKNRNTVTSNLTNQ